MKKQITQIVPAITMALVVLSPSSLLHAGEETYKPVSYEASDVSDINVKRYQQVPKKWQIDAVVAGKSKRTYVYEVTSENDLIQKVGDAIKKQFGISMTNSELEEVLDIQGEITSGIENFEDIEISKIKASRYKQISGKWQVQVKHSRGVYDLFVYDITNKNELVNAITDAINKKYQINILWSDVEGKLEYDVNGFNAPTAPVTNDKETKIKKPISDASRDEILSQLLQIIILLLMNNGNESGIDIGSLLKSLNK